MTGRFDDCLAIVLAGGTGRRMGGASKPDVPVAGRRMLDHVLGGLGRLGIAVVVVGPPDLAVPAGTPLVLEDPPLGGPAAGIAAGFRAAVARFDVRPDTRIAVLACDAPFAPRALPVLYDAFAPPTSASDGIMAVTPDGRRQSLLSLIGAGALGGAIADLDRDGGLRDRSVRALLGGLDLMAVDVPAWAMDADTPGDVAELEGLAGDVPG